MASLIGHSVTYRIALGPQPGRKVFTLQTLPAGDPDDPCGNTVAKVAGFSLHAGVAAKAYQRKKLERLCRPCPSSGCRSPQVATFVTNLRRRTETVVGP